MAKKYQFRNVLAAGIVALVVYILLSSLFSLYIFVSTDNSAFYIAYGIISIFIGMGVLEIVEQDVEVVREVVNEDKPKESKKKGKAPSLKDSDS